MDINQLNEQRQIRGYSILAKGINPKAIDEDNFLIPSQTTNRKYRVRKSGSDWSCECKDFYYRGVMCKHIYALREKINSDNSFEIVRDLEEPVKCVYCGSDNIIKKDKRKNKFGEKQRYLCKYCNRKFVTDVFKKIKGDGKIVTLTMDLFYKGLSLRDISDTIYQFYGLKISHETIRCWITKFTKVMNEFVNMFQSKISEAWHIDEQAIKSKGKQRWSWNVLDEQTRFLIANVITDKREIEDARLILQKAKEVTKAKPKFVITDGLWSYEKAIRKEFVTHPRRKGHVNHIRLETIQSKINQNDIERFHGTFREFDKVRRGFKGKEQDISDGFRTYYNFIKNHMGISKTPAQASNIDLQLGQNRWLELLKMSMENNKTRHLTNKN
jgi:transposase-like protein